MRRLHPRSLPLSLVLLTALLLSACNNIPSTPPDTESTLPQNTDVGKISSLSWLTGTWRGPLGEQLLEEQWSIANAGTIAALVRFFDGPTTNILELLSIRITPNGPEMLIQQWSGTMQSLQPVPQRMALTQQGPRSVTFESASPGGMKRLQYSSPDTQSLHIAVELTEGTAFELKLARIDGPAS